MTYLRKKRRWLALLAVPALVLRALLPVGFMPVAASDGWIGFCPDAGALPAAVAGHHHHHEHANGGGGGGQQDPSPAHHAPCLFAAGALPPVAPSVFVPGTASAARALRPATAAVASGSIPTIQRAQSPRAPPAQARAFG